MAGREKEGDRIVLTLKIERGVGEERVCHTSEVEARK